MLTLDKAEAIADKVISKATELQQKVSVAIVDTEGRLVILKKMDGALAVSPDFAESKARTSALLGLKTSDIQKYAQPSMPYFGINHALNGTLMTIPGGVPLKDGEKAIGAVGVGGSYDVMVDEQIASV